MFRFLTRFSLILLLAFAQLLPCTKTFNSFKQSSTALINNHKTAAYIIAGTAIATPPIAAATAFLYLKNKTILPLKRLSSKNPTAEDIKAFLGFNPGFDPSHITITPQNTNQKIKVCFFSHGFGDLNRYDPISVEKNILSIHFDYHYSENTHLTGGPGANIFKNAFGQDLDVLTLLCIVLSTYEKLKANGFSRENIDLNFFGHSMGAGATINALETIAHPNDYKDIWKKLGCQIQCHKVISKNSLSPEDENDIKELASCINNVYVACPLVSLEELIASKNIMKFKKNGTNYLHFLGKIAKIVLGLSNPKYNPFNPEPIDNLEKILKDQVNLPFKKMVINLAKIDNIVGNTCDNQLQDMAAQYKAKNVSSIFEVNLGAEEEHCCIKATSQQLQIALNS